VYGAREHNLKNIDVAIPRNKLVVITGISGSGKSSLAFDTIYAEGQRRYMESFSAYARSFLGDMERPEVDKINGLSPVISIEQKTTSRNPRSTVGTVTEIYDFLRLLYARTAEAFSYVTGQKMTRQSQDQIIEHIISHFAGQKLVLLAPVVKGRKGHYRELFVQIGKSGFTKVRVDGQIQDITPKMQLDRYKVHDIEIVIDRIIVREEDRFRISQSVGGALKHGKGIMMISDEKGNVTQFSQFLMDPVSGIAYDEPAPNAFSFNSPYGACPVCNGLGQIEEITIDSGGARPVAEHQPRRHCPAGRVPRHLDFQGDCHHPQEVQADADHAGEGVSRRGAPGAAARLGSVLKMRSEKHPDTVYNFKFEGIVTFLQKQQEYGSEKTQDWIQDFMTVRTCPECNGARLKKESLHFKIDGKNIAELAWMDVNQLADWFATSKAALPTARTPLPRKCSRKSANASASCSTSASTTSPSTGPCVRCRAARPSAFAWPRRSVRSSWAYFTSSTSRASACTSATTSSSSRPSSNCATWATPSWWWSTTRT
jgi:excinuclease ABC subunit A